MCFFVFFIRSPRFLTHLTRFARSVDSTLLSRARICDLNTFSGPVYTTAGVTWALEKNEKIVSTTKTILKKKKKAGESRVGYYIESVRNNRNNDSGITCENVKRFGPLL